MKASELIKELEKAIAEFGDLQIDEVKDLAYDPDLKIYYMVSPDEYELAIKMMALSDSGIEIK